ncbi:MAG: hypothetical protein WA884_01920 [Methyloceanibacter sp.]
MPDFSKIRATVVGVSKDSVASHRSIPWASPARFRVRPPG